MVYAGEHHLNDRDHGGGVTCAECEYGRAEAWARGKIAVRCFCPETEEHWRGATVLVTPAGYRPQMPEALVPAWCPRKAHHCGEDA